MAVAGQTNHHPANEHKPPDFSEAHSIMSKNKSARDVARAPVELVKDFGDAILSISKQESDEQTAALKSVKPKNNGAAAGAGPSSRRLLPPPFLTSAFRPGLWHLPLEIIS
jgi:hypothetical protein